MCPLNWILQYQVHHCSFPEFKLCRDRIHRLPVWRVHVLITPLHILYGTYHSQVTQSNDLIKHFSFPPLLHSTRSLHLPQHSFIRLVRLFHQRLGLHHTILLVDLLLLLRLTFHSRMHQFSQLFPSFKNHQMKGKKKTLITRIRTQPPTSVYE